MVPSNQKLSPKEVCVWAALPILATAIVFWQGTIPVAISAKTLHDKVAHFLAFGGLSLLCVPLVRAVSVVRQLSPLARVAACAGYSTLIGGTLELWQAALPYRSAEWLDFVADAVGAILVSGVVWLVLPSLWRLQPKA